MGAGLVIFLRSGDWAARYQAAVLALTAAAHGEAVVLALSFEPLAAWVGHRFDDGAPPEASAARVGSLTAMLEEGRRELGLKVVACDTAVRLAGLEPAAAAPVLDGLPSLPELWRLAASGRALSV